MLKKILDIIIKLLRIIGIGIILILILGIIYLLFQYISFKIQYSRPKIRARIETIRSKTLYTKKENIDKRYLEAVVAAEDKRFFNHGPFDYIAILRAMNTNFQNKKMLEGGSTITQQFVKNGFLDQSVNVKRKIFEALIAIEIENMYSKDEILELYVNTSYFGSGYYSIKEATLGYFGKLPNEINLNQATFLAGVPNAPSIYDPRVNKDKAKQRQSQVMKKMFDELKITGEEIKEIELADIEVISRDRGNKLIKDQELKEKK